MNSSTKFSAQPSNEPKPELLPYRARLVQILEALTGKAADLHESDDHLARALERATIEFETEAMVAKEAGYASAFHRRRLGPEA